MMDQFTVKPENGQYRSVFPADMSNKSELHDTKLDAWWRIVMLREKYARPEPIDDVMDCARTLWQHLQTVPVVARNGQYVIDDYFLDFRPDTPAKLIITWFEATFEISVHHDLMT